MGKKGSILSRHKSEKRSILLSRKSEKRPILLSHKSEKRPILQSHRSEKRSLLLNHKSEKRFNSFESSSQIEKRFNYSNQKNCNSLRNIQEKFNSLTHIRKKVQFFESYFERVQFFESSFSKSWILEGLFFYKKTQVFESYWKNKILWVSRLVMFIKEVQFLESQPPHEKKKGSILWVIFSKKKVLFLRVILKTVFRVKCQRFNSQSHSEKINS